MRGERFEKPMTTAEGLFANMAFCMTTSDDGSFWIGSYGGVTRLRSGPR
jgi:ligand-binding sensor domain-containing protein